MAELEMRAVAGDRDAASAWVRGVFTGFLDRGADVSQEEMELRLARQELSRAVGFFDGDRCVATFNSFPQRVTTVGGGQVSANAVSAVTVTATHRRRGLLTRMMLPDLRAAKERGEPVATLIAAEYRIYGRFGFGPATGFVNWRVRKARSGWDGSWSTAGLAGELSMVEDAEVRRLLPELHANCRAGTPGMVDRNDFHWDRITRQITTSPAPPATLNAVYRDADGTPRGVVCFTVAKDWDTGLPDGTATVRLMYAADDAAERALWRLLLSLDWVTTVDSGPARPDAPLPLLLPDPRAASVVETGDQLWLRPLDVPALLTARSYPAAGELVLEVRDPLGLAGGRFLLSAGPDGASCAATTRSADLTLDVGTLGRFYLGEDSVAALVAAELVAEHTNGAADRADLLFRTGRRPWCPDIF
ncbi:GNAT family N-acetyltransferase [Streptomyces sp. DSM 44915]|uniref:GNAT family N-acetyltransferase n=1 Tax=Streptomyces chisholmiae TaxID=3075540 RepID=A0ABU2K0Q1_9ACTN|nr:GNAT family N-acetyltransferase [Streptomyces sp. DSM 44915]MDT0270841.1 GNAT family N-acetyltransferase [Streptomyces sp. DSM 44915]